MLKASQQTQPWLEWRGSYESLTAIPWISFVSIYDRELRRRFQSRTGPLRRRLGRLLLRATLALFLLSIAQVLYVRLFRPPMTLTMISRGLDAWRDGKDASIRWEWVELETVSRELQRAVLVGEDDQFYQHHGFDVTQIRRAWESNRAKRQIRGASTISQQTARNLFLWQHRSWLRKGLEAYYTV